MTHKGDITDDGLEEGFWQTIFPNGTIANDGYYTNGIRVGRWNFYDVTGEIMGVSYYII